MKKYWMLFVMLGLILQMTGIAHAQKVDVLAGYSYEQDNVQSPVGLHGYNFAATWNLNSNVGIEANFAGHHGHNVTYSQALPHYETSQNDDILALVFGPKLTHAIGSSNPFEIYAHFMVGSMKVRGSTKNSSPGFTYGNSLEGTGFGFVTGGGLDWFHGKWGIRILEVDLSRVSNATINTNSSCGSTNCGQTHSGTSAANFRMASGFLLRFGKP